ncbi:MarR family transcriptional regulator [Emticicia sp. CRIBPO]|uniref:GbsR/MarR family transcriptional regulator n=1 Tax=Emticicia sp. CRIBPO TaxID=2683258 RepID=UPI001412479C|nr:MarR family transcriptional regulator [Emticicia sp. CRIBPO]NBA87835.1 MarR family transcriptional regulator [Emticicia sp. CRIBPO]
MSTVKITEEQLQLVEKLGLVFEGPGLQPAAARVAALLVVSDTLELTFDDIREILNLSKSATSNAINLLLNVHRIEYITKPGDRKRYFRSNLARWKNVMKEKFMDLEKTNSVLKEVVDQRTPATKEFNQSLEEMVSLMRFMNQQIPRLFKEWEKSKS